MLRFQKEQECTYQLSNHLLGDGGSEALSYAMEAIIEARREY